MTEVQEQGKLKLANWDEFATVDARFLPILEAFSWRVQGPHHQIAASIPLGRFVMALATIIDKRQVDHIDRNTFNNTLSNLRMASSSENSCNKGLVKRNKSGYIGVSWSKQHKKWAAQIKIGKKHKNLGRFESKQDAARAYNKALMERKDIRDEFKVYNDL